MTTPTTPEALSLNSFKESFKSLVTEWAEKRDEYRKVSQNYATISEEEEEEIKNEMNNLYQQLVKMAIDAFEEGRDPEKMWKSISNIFIYRQVPPNRFREPELEDMRDAVDFFKTITLELGKKIQKGKDSGTQDLSSEIADNIDETRNKTKGAGGVAEEGKD